MIRLVGALILVVGLVGATVSATPTKKCAYLDYRLPRRIVPKAYNLRLDVNTEQLSYSGSLEIELKIKKNNDVDRNIIVLNVHPDVHVEEVSYFHVFIDPESGINKDSIKVTEICRDDENELLVITLADDLVDQSTGQLSVSFEAKIRHDNTGIYMSKYTTQAGLDGYHVSTDFKPNKARRAFPCFDEPSFKATFTIELTHEPAKVALANTELLSEAISNGRKVSRFQTTPLMSTYLVAFAIGEFHYIETKPFGERLKIRAYTPVGKSQQAEFALRAVVSAITYLEEYFSIPFPLKKLDLLSGVQRDLGATENWGLIVYNETSFLFDPENMSPISMGDIAYAVIQAVTKQWFGNLVTLQWWDDLWLQEGFAGWMANFLTARLYPKLQWELIHLVETQQKALEKDTGWKAPPIRVTVGRTNINSILGDFLQAKSAAVIRVLHDDYVGSEHFKGGVRRYLGDNKYRNVNAIELWQIMTTLSGKPVEKFIQSWTERSGHPMVRAQVSSDGLKLILEQRHAQQRCSTSKRPSSDPIWIIPITILLSDGVNPALLMRYDLDQPKQEVDLPDWFKILQNEHHWLEVNAYSRGFYRVHHVARNLLTRLRRPCQAMELNTSDRIGLIDNMEAQVRSGLLQPTASSDMLKWFAKDTQGSVLGRVARALTSFRPFLDEKSVASIEQIFIRAYWQNQLTSPFLQNPETRHGLGVADSFGLVTAYSILLEFNYGPLVRDALALFDDKRNEVAPIIRELVYKAVALHGSSEQLGKLMLFPLLGNNCEEEVDRIKVALALVSRTQGLAASSSQDVCERLDLFPERIKRARLA